jgi:hypothetical protein
MSAVPPGFGLRRFQGAAIEVAGAADRPQGLLASRAVSHGNMLWNQTVRAGIVC